jgi:hypothetical protein
LDIYISAAAEGEQVQAKEEREREEEQVDKGANPRNWHISIVALKSTYLI